MPIELQRRVEGGRVQNRRHSAGKQAILCARWSYHDLCLPNRMTRVIGHLVRKSDGIDQRPAQFVCACVRESNRCRREAGGGKAPRISINKQQGRSPSAHQPIEACSVRLANFTRCGRSWLRTQPGFGVRTDGQSAAFSQGTEQLAGFRTGRQLGSFRKGN